MTQSVPIRAPRPIVTFGNITVLSPITAPSPIETNAPIGRLGPDPRVSGHRRHRVHAGRGAPRRCEESDGACEREVGVSRAQHRAGRRWRIVAKQHGRGACVGQRRFVLGVGEEREIAGLRVLNASHADDLDVAVALETAGEAFSELA